MFILKSFYKIRTDFMFHANFLYISSEYLVEVNILSCFSKEIQIPYQNIF